VNSEIDIVAQLGTHENKLGSFNGSALQFSEGTLRASLPQFLCPLKLLMILILLNHLLQYLFAFAHNKYACNVKKNICDKERQIASVLHLFNTVSPSCVFCARSIAPGHLRPVICAQAKCGPRQLRPSHSRPQKMGSLNLQTQPSTAQSLSNCVIDMKL
jgi:hypothetical protein